MTITPLPDAEARWRIHEDLDSTLFVEAAAGTGKTTALVARIVALLRTGRATLEQIVAVTFTEKAAGEMKLRLREEIERTRHHEATTDAERVFLDAALGHLELAHIGTIHAFCSDLLSERPVEARLDPRFRVAAEDEARGLLDEAFHGWFERVLDDPPEGIRRVLRRRPRWDSDGGPRAQLRGAVANLVEHRDFPSSWRRDDFDREEAIDRALAQIEETAALAEKGNPRDYLTKAFVEIRQWSEENTLREAVRGRDYDALEADLRDFAANRNRRWAWNGWNSPFAPDVTREEAREAKSTLKRELDELIAACDADLAPLLRDELRPVIEAYELAKARAGKLDFLDLLVMARDLVRSNEAVRSEFQERFTHFFVDEFQDTDPLQAELLLLLSSNDPASTNWREVVPVPGKLFLVGDPKQAIYRFRRADVALYEHVKRMLQAQGVDILYLRASFRARPSMQAVVNSAFQETMQASPDGSQAEYVPLEPVREEGTDQPGVVALPVPRPYGDYGRIVKWRIDESFPDAAGAFVDWLVRESGWTVEEPAKPGVRVPVAPRHVCILLRRFQSFGNDMTRPYVRALEARRVPHVLVGGRSFHEREEVLAIRNALTAIEWPDDELRVFATLRGPFFALHDDALLAFRGAHRRLHPLRWLDEEELEKLSESEREVADALAVLASLHRGRNRRPIARTITRLLEAVRAQAGLAIWPTGEQALANCLRTVDLARRFERNGAPSFRAFVEYLEEEAERGQSEDAPVVEEGTEGVRIMTVHRAKGLEFPVAILADPTCNATSTRPSRHVDPDRGLWAEALCGSVPPDLRDAAQDELRRDAHEAVRLAYVAATRARDLLVVPAIGDLNADDDLARGWLEVLNAAVYPRKDDRRNAASAPRCPTFGDDSTFERPSSATVGTNRSVQPGSHRGRVGDCSIVWWDPASLRLDAQEEVGLRQQRILAADEGEAVTNAGIEAHDLWQKARTRTRESGCAPSLRVAAVTSLSDSTSRVPATPVRVEQARSDATARPAGRRFGTLVHATLAAVDLNANPEQVRDCAHNQGRLIGAADDEVAAAGEAVADALAHPLMRRAAAAHERGDLRREVPVQLQLEDGLLVEGVVDLAFRASRSEGDAAGWTIVDFKTDQQLDASRERYEAQVGLYALAIQRATGDPVNSVLLLV